jgi:mono/diheme cytochrome c family protein
MFACRLSLLGIFAMLLAGCAEPTGELYEPNWQYTLRTDPIAIRTPTTQPNEALIRLSRDEFMLSLPEKGGAILDPAELSLETKRQLTPILDDLFGTPAEPKIAVDDAGDLSTLALDAPTLKAASASFKMRCSTCHGMTGNGRGPSGLFIYPHPRDYRSGKFKLATGSGNSSGRPRFADLLRVLKTGVPGTSMVAFNVLSESELRGLVGSVIHLSIRGEVEQELMKGLLDTNEPVSDLPGEAKAKTMQLLARWRSAQTEVAQTIEILNRPETLLQEDHDAIRRGQKLFVTAGCQSCHERYSGNGVYRYDAWGLPNSVRNLAQPERHWGADAADTARQIRHGIAAANMPGSPTLTDHEVVDLVKFIRELPYPKRFTDDVRLEVER